jgi:hypothetical protein
MLNRKGYDAYVPILEVNWTGLPLKAFWLMSADAWALSVDARRHRRSRPIEHAHPVQANVTRSVH